MNWDSAKNLPFGIILLFGGGFALATGFDVSGLAGWMGNKLAIIGENAGVCCYSAGVCLCHLSKRGSIECRYGTINTSCAGCGSRGNTHFTASFNDSSNSFGFMLPVATAPNTIVFAAERLTVKDMIRAGLLLDIIGILWMLVSMYLYGKWIFNFM